MASTPTFTIFSLLFLFFTTISSTPNGHNITEILSSEPDLSQFNSYLSQTKLADEINARQTVTVLALDNAAMSSLTSNHPLSVIKNLLSLHVLLDYFDGKKLHSLQDGSEVRTTLYQTTGDATADEGSLNITDAKGGSVLFGSALPGSNLTSTYVKSVKQFPYNLSVIQISEPIIVPALLTPTTSVSNLTALLEKAGCKTFASLISSSGVLKLFQNQLDKGITIFAPNDEAFKAKGVPDLSKLSNAELVSLLQFHALNSYSPIETLKTTNGKLTTLAPSAGKYDLSPSTAGDSVTLHTGVDSSRIASTVLDSTPVCIYSVDSLLFPAELFGLSPAPAPAPAPEAISPTPEEAPVSSPPAPLTDSPAESPADAPSGSSADDNAKNGAGERSASLIVAGLSLGLGVISLVL